MANGLVLQRKSVAVALGGVVEIVAVVDGSSARPSLHLSQASFRRIHPKKAGAMIVVGVCLSRLFYVGPL